MGFAFDTTDALGAGALLGLIALQTDETIEHDMRRIFAGPHIGLHVSRIPSAPNVTRETLARMEADLPQAAGLFPPAARYAVVGYGCTSGTMQIGPQRVCDLVRGACRTAGVATPLTGAIAALHHLRARRIGLVTPYLAEVVAPLAAAFEAAGLSVSGSISFGCETEEIVARIAPASIVQAARAVMRDSAPDAVFLSCTNLQTLEIIAPLERELGVPVVSSNLALAWEMAQALPDRIEIAAPGRLFATRPTA